VTTWPSDEPWQEEGRFWLPDDNDQLRYGHLAFNPARGVIAHIMDWPLLPFDVSDVPVMHGESLAGKPFTLIHGLVTHRQDSLGGPGPSGGTVDVLFHTLVRGVHVAAPDDVTAGVANVHIRGLLTLVAHGGDGHAMLSVRPERDSRDHLAIPLPFGRLLLSAGAQYAIGAGHRAFSLAAQAEFVFARVVKLEDVDEAVSPLEDLVVFATRRHAFIETLRLFPPESPGPEVDFEQIAAEVIVCRAPAITPISVEDLPTLRMRFNPGRVADPAKLIVEWYALHDRLGPVWALLFDTLARPNVPIQTRVLHLTAFAEGYHRAEHDEPPLPEADAEVARNEIMSAISDPAARAVFGPAIKYANNQSQRGRLHGLTERALSVLDNTTFDVTGFCRQLTDTRNWLTHWGARGNHVQEGADLYWLLERLELVIAINIMLDVGLDPSEISPAVALDAKRLL
jgi:hypothetical protein